MVIKNEYTRILHHCVLNVIQYIPQSPANSGLIARDLCLRENDGVVGSDSVLISGLLRSARNDGSICLKKN